MIFVILCIVIALGILHLGRSLGRREAEQEFEFMRSEMGLNSGEGGEGND